MKNLQLIIVAILTCSLQAAYEGLEKPNVIIVLTDDQGYGDLSCHGNPILKTPMIDRLYGESIRLNDFHVSPFCTPTRASLMTGHHAGRTGAFRTTGGRSMMHLDEKTIADVFADAGYVTGMAGKWHLGDNAPHRPQDRGFQDVVWHRCGGIGQGSDYWGNTYFNDTYERVTPGSRVGKFEKFKGYCTDVFFREGMRFIEENKEKPFFYYLSFNAPHGPYRVDKKWAKPYQRKDVSNPNFYGMIANIDHNMGILRKRLDELKLSDNTILIFMTDNGTSAGAKFKGLEGPIIGGTGYNAGMRGKKSSIYEGGHRVPFFIYWPKGNLTGGKDIETLTAHIDVLPTLADLCGVKLPADYKSDGLSLKPLLNDPKAPWTRDHLIMQYHGGAYGRNPLDKPFADTVVLTERWRLSNSTDMALHDITTDLAQSKNVIAEHPEVVSKLKALYDPFWKSVSPRIKSPAKIDLGNPGHNPTELCSQDWFMNDKGYPPYSFRMIKKLPRVTAPWLVNVKQAGRYRITLRQWPEAANKPVVAVRAKVKIAGQEKEQEVKVGSKGVVFEMNLPAGPSELWTYLYDKEGKAGGAYFTEVEWLGKTAAKQATPKPTLIPGSEVNLPALTSAKWIQGNGPESFEPGKVYIFECWATWCGPCIAMIPHVNELHKKYYDKGLRIYGMSVWEDDQDKVEKFVKKKGKEMSYPVAFTGTGSAFDKQWLNAAGTKAVPHAFIVRNGKLIASTEAARLTDSLIETLLSGDEGAKKASDAIMSAQKNEAKANDLLKKLYSARRESDSKTMVALLKELKAIDPAHPSIPVQNLCVLIAKKDWQAAVIALKEMPSGQSKTSFISMTGSRLGRSNNHDYPEEFMKVFVKLYSDYVLYNESRIGSNHFAYLSMLQWRLGDKKNATITANLGVEAAKNSPRNKELYTKSFERFAKSVNDGTMPTSTDLSKWYREAKKEAEGAK